MPHGGPRQVRVSPRQSHHLVTPAHPLASYVPGIPRGTRHGPPEQEPVMTITPTSLSRAAAVAAVLAGLVFIGVQINHPHMDAASVTTTEQST